MSVEDVVRKAFDNWKIKYPEQEVTMEKAIADALREAGVFIPDCGPGWTFDRDERTMRIIQTYLQSVKPKP